MEGPIGRAAASPEALAVEDPRWCPEQPWGQARQQLHLSHCWVTPDHSRLQHGAIWNTPCPQLGWPTWTLPKMVTTGGSRKKWMPRWGWLSSPANAKDPCAGTGL